MKTEFQFLFDMKKKKKTFFHQLGFSELIKKKQTKKHREQEVKIDNSQLN